MQQECGKVTVHCPPASEPPILADDGYYTKHSCVDDVLRLLADPSGAAMSLQVILGNGLFLQGGSAKAVPSWNFWFDWRSYDGG